MRVDNQHHLDVYASLSGSHQSLLEMANNIIVERFFGLIVGVYNFHLRLVTKIKFEAAVHGSTSQYAVTRVRNSPRKDVVHCSSGTDTPDHVRGDGAVRSQIFIEVGSQSFREAGTP